MNASIHDRIEAIAGAIALGEASDQERREYREHIAACMACLRALGGECEIERVASTVGAARDVEVWEPALGDVVATRMRRQSRGLRWGLSVFGVALAASLGAHALLAAGIGPVAHAPASPVIIDAGATRIVLEQRATVAKPPAAVRPGRLIVTHNVVQIARAPVAAPPAESLNVKVEKPRQIVAMTVHPDAAPRQTSPHSGVPVWRRNQNQWRTVAQTTTTSITETAPETLTHSAESIQVSANLPTREVAPMGGEAAINPQPPMIAYAEGAEGTTVFEVRVDERGTPTKCIITKSAGYPVLDDAVCKAAMKARYTPKMVDGRAVPGVYHDAFTFQMSDQSASTQGVDPTIPVAGPARDPRSIMDAPQQSSPLAGPGGSP